MVEKSKDSRTKLVEAQDLYTNICDLHETELGPLYEGHSCEAWSICEAFGSRTRIYPKDMS